MTHRPPTRLRPPLALVLLILGAALTVVQLMLPRPHAADDAPSLVVGSRQFNTAPGTVEFMDWLATRSMLRGGQGADDGSIRAILIDRRIADGEVIPDGGLRAGQVQLDQRGTIIGHQPPAADACSIILVPDERDPSVLMVLCEGACAGASSRCALRFDQESLRFECACP